MPREANTKTDHTRKIKEIENYLQIKKGGRGGYILNYSKKNSYFSLFEQKNSVYLNGQVDLVFSKFTSQRKTLNI